MEYAQSTDSQDRDWGEWNWNAILMTFTLIATIGYGNFAPSTEWGKIFIILYCFIGIPIIMICTGRLAGMLVSGLEYLAVMRMKEARPRAKDRSAAWWIRSPSVSL